MSITWRILAVTSLLSIAAVARAAVDYERDIRPLFAAKCTSCHGPVKQEAGLRLDAGVLVRQGGESGFIASQDAPDDSVLLQRVTSAVPDDRMPPASEGEALTAEQVALVRDMDRRRNAVAGTRAGLGRRPGPLGVSPDRHTVAGGGRSRRIYRASPRSTARRASRGSTTPAAAAGGAAHAAAAHHVRPHRTAADDRGAGPLAGRSLARRLRAGRR